MACRQALIEAQGDLDRAVEILKMQGLLLAKNKASRTANDGIVESYIHTGGRIGTIVEVNCETDFVARTGEFKELAHELAMQIAALCPRIVSPEEAPDLAEPELQTDCLLRQPYIKDPTKTIQNLIDETIAKVGENIRVNRFSRFEIGAQESAE